MDDLKMMAFSVAFWLVLAAVLVGPPWLVVRWMLRRDKRKREQTAPVALTCPRCASGEVSRLAADRISPFRAYTCRNCNLRMRPFGTGIIYGIVLLASGGVFTLFSMPLWLDEPGVQDVKLNFKPLAVSGVVAAYAVLQLLRPTPRRSAESAL